MDSIFQVENLNVKIKKRCILDTLSLQIGTASIVGFIGPNGSGKTTTIKACAGQISIDSGVISCAGADINKNYEQYMLKVGFTFDKANFYPNLTGLENLKLFYNLYPKAFRRNIDDCVHMVGLSRRINEKVKTYSFGMRQRLNFAKILLLETTKIIFMDEPLNGVDPEGVSDFRNLILDLRKNSGCSFLISSHLLSELESVSDRLLFIKNGILVDDVLMKNMALSHYITTLEVERALSILNERGIQAVKHTDEIVKIYGEENILSDSLKVLLENNVSFIATESKKQIEEMYLSKVGGGHIG